MTPAQAQLLQSLLAAERRYWQRRLANDQWVGNNDRGIELAGHDRRPAEVLERYGVIEVVNLHGDQRWAFLGSAEAPL